MTRRVIWHAAAEEDASEVYDYLAGQSLVAAERFLDAVEEAVALLQVNPIAGSPRAFRSSRAGGLRCWSPTGFPNPLLFYRATEEHIEIVRLLHGARDTTTILEDSE